METLLKIAIWVSFFCVFNVVSITAQERAVSLVFDSLAYDAMPHFPIYDGSKSQSTEVSLRPFCPTPGHQGALGACVGYAFAYGALTIMEALQEGWTDRRLIDEHRFSPSFVFNQIKKDATDCAIGASLEDAALLLKEKGVCLLKDFDVPTDCQEQPSSNILQKAAQYKIKEAGAIFDRKASAAQKIVALKRYLSDSIPIVANMQVYRSFVYLGKGNAFWHKKESDEYLGMHSLVVTGYNERRQTFELMSSWGTDWAKDGFVEITYEDMGTYCMTAYQVIPADYRVYPMKIVTSSRLKTNSTVTPAPTQKKGSLSIYSEDVSFPSSSTSIPLWRNEPIFYLRGAFDFQELKQNSRGDFERVEAAVYYDEKDKIYRTKSRFYPQKTLFQLQTKDVPRGKYVYVFSCDAQGKVDLHWPKTRNTSTKDHIRWTDMLPTSDVLISIPSSESALQLTHQGVDFLCILYSEEKIPDIVTKITAFKNYNSTNFMQQLERIFQGQLIDLQDIVYQPDKMLAECHSTVKKGIIMPIVLLVEAQ